MITNKELTFTRFYTTEFLQEVLNKIPKNVSGDNAGLAAVLIRHLIKQEDVADGIELIAREQGSGELSIFLFDIVDRIEDYPPTVVYDALPDIVDDFVNGLDLMMEEEETVAAIKNVNQKFQDDSGEVSEETVAEAEEIKEPAPVTDEADEIAKEEEEVPVEEITGPPDVIMEPEEPELNFEQFFENEFMQKVSGRIDSDLDSIISSSVKSFCEVLLDNISTDFDPKISPTLADAIKSLRAALPWKTGNSYTASELVKDEAKLIDEYVAILKQLSENDPEIISNSVVQARLVLPEPPETKVIADKPEIAEKKKPAKEFVKEEVPQKPTTIDEILSEYFQSEVEEHINTISVIAENLKSDPADRKIIKEMITSLQSFNEISMIHGYVPIESFCGRLIDICSNGLKDKMQVDTDQISSLPEVFDILRNTDDLKDPKKETEESRKLEDIANILETSLFIPKKKTPVKPKKKKEKKIEPEKKEDTGISYDEKENLAAIIRDIFQNAKTIIMNDLGAKESSARSREIFKKMQSAADLVNLVNISKSIGIFLTAMKDGSGLASDHLKTIFSEFIEKITVDMKPADWESRLQPEEVAKEEISSDNKSQLLEVIAQIEDLNLTTFGEALHDMFEQNNQSVYQRQLQIFSRLKNNLILIGADEKTALADYFCDLFSKQGGEPRASEEQRQEIVQSYKIFIQSLRSKEAAVNAEDLVAILKEMFSDQKSEIIESEDEKTEKIASEETEKVDDEGDEDLAEIFKQEAKSAIEQITDALQNLDKEVQIQEAYQTIERNIHSLKSSARLMGNNEVADLAAPLEELCEKLASGFYQPGGDHRDLVREAVTTITGIINGDSVDSSDLIKKLNEVEFPEFAEDEDLQAGTGKKSMDAEKPLFSSGSEEDDDLLQIFKEESAEFVKLLKEASSDLEKNPTDQDAIKKLEYASHSLKSPAKMLGFSEIGQLGDVIENVAEAAKKGELNLNRAMVKKVAESIVCIGELSKGKKPDPAMMIEIFSSMDISRISLLKDDDIVDTDADQENINIFLSEAEDLLDKINHDLLALEKNPDDKGLLDSISRYLHTLKGGAQIIGQEKIGGLAHAIEDIFSYLKDNEKQIPEQTSDLVFRAIDGILTITGDLKTGKGDTGNIDQELILALNNEVDSLQKSEVPVIRPVEIDKAPEVPKDAEKSIKITTERLDSFVNMAAELVINKTQLADQLDKLKDLRAKIDEDREKIKKTGNEIESVLGKQPARSESGSQENVIQNFEEILANLDDLSHRVSIITQKFDQNINQISHLSKSLHDNIMQVRMVPTEVLFDRFPRAVRDMAKKQKKKINLLVEGEDTEMDRAMIESLTDPVMHLVRNAIDHGIELPKDRKENGKNEDGIVLLKARRDKNQVIIEVQDDGKGISIDDIRRAIVRKKLATKAEVEKLSEDDILDYIFHPGFTTKRSASSVSGRGVGLDVVMDEIKKLKGDIRVSSTPGKGTIFSIRLPLTLAITQALLVKIKSETLAIPLNSVEETQNFDEKKIITKKKQKYIKVRRNEIPIVYLSEFVEFDKKISGEKDIGNIIVVKDGSVRYGLIVDRALRREEIVVRSLGDELEDMDYISGGTIFGDGSVVLIVDIPAITRKIEADYFGDQRDFSSLESARNILKDGAKKPATKKKSTAKKKDSADIKQKKIEERKPTALIVDDSLSVRKFVSSVLERNNYATALAEDGSEALEELKTSEFDIIITDLEMPKMQGFELIEKIREQKRLKDVPIVILTGKAARENKEKGIQLGANAYIVKPFKENDLLKTLEKFIKI